MEVKIKRLHDAAALPTLATPGAACVDVIATEIEYTPGSNEAVVKLGFATAIPEGYKACLAPRSSFTKTCWVLQNAPAQIDSDYRGEWMLKFRGIPTKVLTQTGYGAQELKQPRLIYSAFPYKVGDRVAQMWIEKVNKFSFKPVTSLDDTERGEGGFGSTGK